MEKQNKSSFKPILKFIMLGSPLLIYGLYQMFYGYKNKSINYFNSTQIELTGVVKSKKLISHGAGYICLDLKKTNHNYYNPSDSLKTYYCLISNSKAILCESGISTFNLGDIFIVSSKKDSCFLYNNQGILKWGTTLSIPDWIESPKSFDLCK